TGRGWVVWAGVLILPGLLLAIGLQIVQFWIAGRVPAMADAGLNLCGILAGIAMALPFRRHHRREPAKGDLLRSHLSIPMVLIALWIAYRWFPLVPSLDLQHLKDGLKPLLRNPDVEIVRVFHDAVAWLVCFRLLTRTPL